jgi:hypothetical protein
LNPGVADLLKDLRQRGAILTVDGDRVRVKAPKRILTPVFLAALRAHTDDVRQFLQEGVHCVRCGLALPDGWELCEPCLRANTACLDCGATSDPIAKKPVAGYARCIPCVVKGTLEALGLEKRP